MRIPTEYEWLKVVVDKEQIKWYVAYYDPKTDIIHLLPNFLKKSDFKQKYSLLHEHAHYVFIKKVSRKFQKLRKLIHWFDENIIKRINKYFDKDFKENKYVTKYASKNFFEWFSENVEEEYKRIELWKPKFKWWVWFKVLVCNKLYNYFK